MLNTYSKTTEHKQVFIDGIAYPLNEDISILKFIKKNIGQKIVPTLCAESRIKAYGACRVCSVDVKFNETEKSKAVASCHTPISDGMHISTNSKNIQRLRKNIIELVLTDHPLDCLTCEANGACELQDVAAAVGIRKVRYVKGKNHLDRKKDTSHPYMRMDLSKCINCSRCVRACDEIQGQFVLTMSGRGFDAKISVDDEGVFGDSSCVSCGACAQICPTSAISDVFQAKSIEAENKIRTVCSYCGVGCNLEVAVKDNQVLSIQAPKDAEVNAGHTCLKGRYAFKFYNHPDRLTSPLIKKNGIHIPCSWDEAYSYIAGKLKSIQKNHGADAIAGISSARCTNEENFLFQKMIRAAIGTNNIDCCARVCHSPTAFGMQKSFGTGAATNSISDLLFTDAILLIGANPTAAHPVTGAKIKQATLSGKTLIVLDPIETELAKLADIHLPLRPGTNVAVLNMMQYFIVKADLIDQQFINERCEDYDKFTQSIMKLDVDAMAEISGLDKTLVEKAAIFYASAKNAMSFHGLGVTEHTQGTKTVTQIANLAMMTGNIGKLGVGVNPLRGQNNVQGAADMGCQPHQGAGYLPMNNIENQNYYSDKYKVPSPTSNGKKIPEMFDGAIIGDIKAMWILGEDVVQTDPNTHHVIKSLQSLDLLVVQEIFYSETAKLADIVLPGCSFLEKSGTFTNGERRIQKVNAAVEPLKGCKTDGQIIAEMMQTLGYQQEDYDAADVLSDVADVVPFFKGVTWDNLGTQGLQWPVKDNGVDTKILHENGFTRGKGKFHYYDFEESKELEQHQSKFPFILTTGRELQHYNAATMTRRTANSELLDADIILINPKDAKNKNLEDGNRVKLISSRGEITLNISVTKKVKPGVLRTTFHFPEVLVNMLTSAETDEETKCPEYKVVAVDIEKVKTT